MILIVHTERSHIAAIFAGAALLLTLAGWSYASHEKAQNASDALLAWYNVLAMEKQLDRFDQVMAAYNIKPIPVAGDSRD